MQLLTTAMQVITTAMPIITCMGPTATQLFNTSYFFSAALMGDIDLGATVKQLFTNEI